MSEAMLVLFFACYIFAGVMTVREWFWINDPTVLSFKDLCQIGLVILIWPLAWYYWKCTK